MKHFFHFAMTIAVALTMSVAAMAQNKYVKVLAEPEDWTGTYLFVYEADDDNNEAYVFDGSLKAKDIDSKGNFFKVSNASQQIYGTEVRVIEGNDKIDAAVFKVTRDMADAAPTKRVIVIESDDLVDHEWDTQFWIVANSPFHAGDHYEISMEIRAEETATIGTQTHKAPGTYLYWEAVGKPTFDTEWSIYKNTGTFASDSEGGYSVAFNLNDFNRANKFYIGSISLKVNGVEQVNNGDLKSDDMSSFLVKEKRGATLPATLANEDGSVVGGQLYYIQSASGYYIGYDNSEKGEPNLEYSNEVPLANSIAMEPGKTSIDIVGSVGNYQLRFNADEGKERFRYHELGKKKSIKFYQLMEASAGGDGGAISPIVINEVMQSNIDCIMDDQNEFPDSWVELYNSGVVPINLRDYKIGLSDKASEAFRLSDYSLPAKGYKIVYCDKFDGDLAWHAPFRLESGKNGSIYLFKGNEVVDKIVGMKKQPAPNIAYGRKTDAAGEFGYQAKPTPGAGNCGTIYGEILNDPIFSVKGQVFESAQNVELTLSLPDGAPEGTKIVYTTDGKEPTENSLVYTAPINFSNTRVIRAKLICDGYLSPRSVAQSYLFLGRNMTLPVVSLVTDRKYFYDSKIGIYNSNNNSDNKLDWRRPLNIEYFAAPGEESKINQLGETRVAGGGSRNANHKTLVLYANKRFDAEKKRFDYEFFPEDRPGQTEFKSIMLRNSGNDYNYLFMRDAVMQRSFYRHVDLDGQAYSPAAIFINGEYLGMLNIRERSNEDNIYTNYDKLEDIDMFENWWELKTGSWDNYNKFKDFYTEQGHTMAEFEKWMDCEEFANLMIMNIFYSNRDFPGNNIVMWRPIKDDGRWRWIAKDTDFGLGLYDHPYNYNTINWVYNSNFDPGTNWANQADHTRLFRRLMADVDFNRMFIDRCSVYMGDFLNFECIWEELWGPMYERIKTEYPYHRQKLDWSVDYSKELEKAQNWLKKRPDAFYDQLSNYYKLGKAIKLEVNKDLTDTELADIEIEMNGVKLSKGVFKGKFHQGREVRIKGKNVAAWAVTTIFSDGNASAVAYDGSEMSFIMPNCSSVTIRATVGEAEGIEQIASDASANAVEIYDASGIRHKKLQKGQNIIRMSDGSAKKVIY